MKPKQTKVLDYLAGVGISPDDVVHLAADKTLKGVSQLAMHLANNRDMRRIVTEIRQADGDVYANLRIVLS